MEKGLAQQQPQDTSGGSNMTKYIMTEHPLEEHLLCGIAAIDHDRILDELTDISIDHSLVQRMAETLTHHEVSIVHFREVVEDLLAQV